MNTTLFAIDINSNEIIISETSTENNKINFIERINKIDNIILYNAVVTLTSITNATQSEIVFFKPMHKVCQTIYNKHKTNSK